MLIKNMLDEYLTSREFLKLTPNSQKTYRGMIKHAIEDHFLVTNRVEMITTDFVDKLYDKLVKQGRLAHANMFMRVMRRIWSIMVRKRKVKYNPFREMGLSKTEPRTTRWTKEQVEMYLKYTWNTNIKTTNKFNQPITIEYKELSLLARLCYTLGQRPGDMINLDKSNFNEELTEIKFTQQKTGKKMLMSVDPELKRYLVASGIKTHKPITLPYNKLNIQHREVIKALGFPDLQIRDLRRTAILEVLENGGTDAEAQALGGHTTRDMLNIYGPSTTKMSDRAQYRRRNE